MIVDGNVDVICVMTNPSIENENIQWDVSGFLLKSIKPLTCENNNDLSCQGLSTKCVFLIRVRVHFV